MPGDSFGSVLAFQRGGETFCCPLAEVLEIVEDPSLTHPGVTAPLVAGVLLHNGLFIPVADPACIAGEPPRREGDVILVDSGGAVAGLLADTVLGFRRPLSLSPATWIPPGRLCRTAVMLEEIGRAFLLGAEGLGDMPTVPRPDAAAVPVDSGPPLHLVYEIAGRSYATAYADVERILYRQPMVRIPGGRPPIRHAVEMSGGVVPVLELADAPDGAPSHFVVLSSPLGPLALRVDGIGRPLPMERDGADPGWFPSPGVAGIARHGDRAVSLVTGAALLRDLAGGEGA
ncbi:chemotaxis protein CheW [Azospirillum sp. C340-1]|uniref:Chemotaxis protein CheW n=2 Tax=Azospirillum isscasi TaxID=3053926 RepID=A0ABU0WR13_9PROT|nr:chemotaxis protein CheW [Azospirillum isscasi]